MERKLTDKEHNLLKLIVTEKVFWNIQGLYDYNDIFQKKKAIKILTLLRLPPEVNLYGMDWCINGCRRYSFGSVKIVYGNFILHRENYYHNCLL